MLCVNNLYYLGRRGVIIIFKLDIYGFKKVKFSI